MKDVTGQRFSRLTALTFLYLNDRKQQFWLFTCDCGRPKQARLDNVKSGHVICCDSCQTERRQQRSTSHGQTGSELYKVWSNMRARCSNPNSPDYFRYGGRGIKVCERWDSFELFAQDMGKRPTSEHTIERKDNNGGYEPSNCCWATRLEQAHNRRR